MLFFVNIVSTISMVVMMFAQITTQLTTSNTTKSLLLNTTDMPKTSIPIARPVLVPSQRPYMPILDTLIVHLINSHLNSSNSRARTPTPTTDYSDYRSTAPLNGQYVHSANNSAVNNTEPESADTCINGQTYWDSRQKQCLNCTLSCPSGALVYRACNRTSDLQCICPKGSYMSVVDQTCKQCSECPSGWGVWRTCRWSRNTVCRKCQPGTYSGASVGTLGCIPCSKCGPNQEIISECDGSRDSVCVDRATLANYSMYFGSSEERSFFNELSSQRSSEIMNELPQSIRIAPSSASYALPLYFAILVVIVFSLCIYALVQLRCNLIHHRVPSTSDSSHKLMLPSAPTGVPGHASCLLPSCHHHLHNPNLHQQLNCAPNELIHSNSRYQAVPVYIEPIANHHCARKTSCRIPFNVDGRQQPEETQYKAYYELLYAPNDSMVDQYKNSDLDKMPLDIRNAFENRLGSDSNCWKMLARELGYSQTQIGHIESKSTTVDHSRRSVVDSFKAIRLLLADWSKHMSSSTSSEVVATGLNKQALQANLQFNYTNQQQQQSAPGSQPPLTLLTQALMRIGRVDCVRIIHVAFPPPAR